MRNDAASWPYSAPGLLAGRAGLHGRTRTTAIPMDVAALYRRYGDMVLGRCRTLLRDEADAQEVMQEVFLRLLRYQDGFRGDAAPSTYLFKITTTTCLNRIRTRTRRREDLVDELPPVPDTDSLLDAVELRQLVDDILDGEDERTQQCAIFHFVDGMTHDEVGELLGISGAAVRKRLAGLRRRLRESPPAWLALPEATG